MIASHLILQEPIPWYFDVFMVGLVGIVGWMGYRAFRGVRALFALSAFHKLAPRDADIPMRAISISICYSAVGWLLLFALAVCGTWVIVRANFCSFRQLEITNSSVRLSYEWRFLNREIPLSAVRSIRLAQITHRKCEVEVATTDGRVFRSMDADDEATISDCRRVIEAFQKKRSNKPDAVNPAMALRLTIEDQWRRVTDLGRSARSDVCAGRRRWVLSVLFFLCGLCVLCGSAFFPAELF